MQVNVALQAAALDAAKPLLQHLATRLLGDLGGLLGQLGCLLVKDTEVRRLREQPTLSIALACAPRACFLSEPRRRVGATF